MITLDDVTAAARRLDNVANRTPLLTSRSLNRLTGCEAFLKAECFQRAGSFKFRGAYNAVAQLRESELARGVFAWSSGNHAQALALAASLRQARAVILMPDDAPRAKMEAAREYGAEIRTYDRYGTEDRLSLADRLCTERGMIWIPPYDHPHVMAGQGTCALELIEDAAHLDVLLAQVSGGGLIAGCATAAKSLLRDLRVVGVEPEAGDDTRRSLEAGHRVRIPVPRTIADGQQVEIPGELTFEVNRRLVDEILLVSDDDILRAIWFLFDRMKIVAEPSGASAFAALLTYADRFKGMRVGVIISGGNIGVERFLKLMEKADGPRTP